MRNHSDLRSSGATHGGWGCISGAPASRGCSYGSARKVKESHMLSVVICISGELMREEGREDKVARARCDP